MTPLPRKANIGCGWDKREGYLNVDSDERPAPDLVADVRDLSVLPDAWFEEVLAYDVLEHLPRTETEQTLAGWVRILQPGGIMRLRVPSYLHLVEWLLCGDYGSVQHHRTAIHLAYGTQAHPGDFHLTCFTPLLLREYLHGAGLGIREISVRDGWMFDVVAQRGAPDAVDPTKLYGSRWAFVRRLVRALVRERLAAVRRVLPRAGRRGAEAPAG